MRMAEQVWADRKWMLNLIISKMRIKAKSQNSKHIRLLQRLASDFKSVSQKQKSKTTEDTVTKTGQLKMGK